MSFPLQPDVGEDVLAAFASLAVPDSDAPPLPPAAIEYNEWELDIPECDMTNPWALTGVLG